MRILRDTDAPTKTSGGPPPASPPPAAPVAAAAAAATTPTTPESPAAPPPAAPAAPTTAQLPLEELQRLYTRDRELGQKLEAEQAAVRKAEADRLIAEAKAGNIEQAFNTYRATQEAESARLRQAWHENVRVRTVAESITAAMAEMGATFSDGDSLAQIQTILGPEFVVVENNGQPEVRDLTTNRPAAVVVAERLKEKRFDKFRAATSKGGPPQAGGAVSYNPTANQPQFDAQSREPQAGENMGQFLLRQRRLG